MIVDDIEIMRCRDSANPQSIENQQGRHWEMGNGKLEMEGDGGFLSHGGTPNHPSHSMSFLYDLVLKSMVTWGSPTTYSKKVPNGRK